MFQIVGLIIENIKIDEGLDLDTPLHELSEDEAEVADDSDDEIDNVVEEFKRLNNCKLF